MSTILDALRKVAEEQHTHGTDVRTRLLSFPSRLDSRARQRPGMVWIVSAGVAITCFAAGAGLMYWQSRTSVQEEPATLARSTPDAPMSATRVLPATPVTPSPAGGESQPQRRTPDLSQGILENVMPVPIPPSAPVVPRAKIEGRDQSPTFPSLSPSLRGKFQSDTPVVTKEEPRPVPSPVPMPFSGSPGIPPVDPQPALGTPPVVPSTPFIPPAVTDVLKFAEQIRPPVVDAEGMPVPNPALNIPTFGTSLPPQSPPVAEEIANTQTDVSLSFLQWSPDAEKRMAFLRVRGGPLTMAQEGDNVGGLTVTEISSEAVTLRSGDKTWVLQVR